jgi:hypothetical protein
VIPEANIGGGVEFFSFMFLLPPDSVYRRASNLFAVVIRLGRLFVSLSLYFLHCWHFCGSGTRSFLASSADFQDSRSSLSSQALMSSSSEKSSVSICALLLIAHWNVWRT